MAKQIITSLIDDLDGSPAEDTVSFALDGNAYTIDLNNKNALKLREFLDPYIQAGTRAGRVPGVPQLQRQRPQVQRVSPTVEEKQRNTAIREWANNNGYDVSDRGRIPGPVVEAYNASQVVGTVKKHAGARSVSFSK